MNVLRKLRWQEPVRHACPEHPNHAMHPVRVQGRELWKCDHPAHVINISALKAGVIPARLRAKSLPDNWRVIPPPIYALPDPQPTGAMRPVPVARHAQGPEPEDAWLNSTQHPTLRLTPEECKLNVADASQDEDTAQIPALTLLRRLTARKG